MLADRVAYNREIAGVHYGMDSQAGQCAALVCVHRLSALPAAPAAFQDAGRRRDGELALP